ncbi:MAG: hypothetical protein ACRDWE_06745 [Acidimicrobiales bacterium]
MTTKQRLSASVDAELLQAAQRAVNEGRADSISAWVSDALRLKAEHDKRMQALDSFLARYEAEHGTITEAEIDDAVHKARSKATVVRSKSARKADSRRGAA